MVSVIREATTGDLDELCSLEKRCFERKRFSEEHMMWLLENPDATSYIYETKDQVVASIILIRLGGIGKVVSIGVDPRYRRKGIARQLMVLGERAMREVGANTMHLEVGVTNDAAMRLYESMGYEPCKRIPGYYSWGEDAFVMKKRM